MELSETFRQKLENEGFSHVYEWTDKPGTVYQEHMHQDKVTLIVTDGSIEMHIASKIFTLKQGDRYDVPPKTKHTAVVGSHGCSFVVGEMIKGDS